MFWSLNRYWIKKQRQHFRPDYFYVYTLHLVMWKRDFFLQIQDKLSSAMMENTEPVTKRLVEEAFCSMQFDERDQELALDPITWIGSSRQQFGTPFGGTEGSSVGATAQV